MVKAKYTIIYVASLLLLGIFILLAVDVGRWTTQSEIKEQIVNVSLQVLVFGLAGGLIKLLIDGAAELRNFRSEVLRRLGDAHRSVYRARRLLNSVDDNNRVQLIGELMDARQDLGSVYHDIRVNGLLKNGAEIKIEIDSMRSYLEEVIEAAIAENHAELPEYLEFLDFRGDNRRYQEGFKSRYLSAKELVDDRFQRPEHEP